MPEPRARRFRDIINDAFLFDMRVMIWAALVFTLISFGYSVASEAAETQARWTLGASAFLDEETPLDHFLVGGSVRFYLTERFSLEPEFMYMHGPDTDRDYTLMANAVYDVSTSERSRVYVIGGAGLLRHREEFPGAPEPEFTSSEWTVSGGMSIQIFLSDSVFVAPEFRFGWEPLYRITGSLGFTFGKR